MSVVVRFAPSPTGLLHLGNARTAVVNWLYARAHAGRLVLRIDDTDRERGEERFAVALREDLRWLGLTWEAEVRQSARDAVYAAALERLRRDGRVYPAYETAEELAALRASQRARGLPPRYDRAALALGPAGRAELEAAGRRPHWRFRLGEGAVTFTDLVRGRQDLPLGPFSDPVLCRETGAFTYTFASVVDDLELGITTVIRGEDHLTNTAVQIDLMAALGGSLPAFAHLPLVLDAAGGKLSKRLGSSTIAALRERGSEARAVGLLLACLGTGRAPDPASSLEDLARGFELAAFGMAQPRLDPAELERLSVEVLRRAPLPDVADRLRTLGLPHVADAFWTAVRGNLDRLEDARAWWDIIYAPLTPILEDAAFTDLAAELLATAREPQSWIATLSERTGRKGQALYRPLRLALTGREHGPRLLDLIALIGPERALRRLRGETC
jgi:glutamyl-tRNA synthetase